MMYNAHTDPDVMTRTEERLYRQSVIAANDAFCKLMLKQIARGKEHAVAGTFVDTSACTTHRFQPEPQFSGMGSPASLCADKGDTDPKEVASYV